jgi:RHS repeat-associated protein
LIVAPGPTFDEGTVTLTVGGVMAATYQYGVGDTPSTVAEGLAGNQASGSLVTLAAVDDTVSITAIATNASTNYPYILQAVSSNPTLFPEPSFVYSQASGSLPAGTSQVTGNLEGGANQNAPGGTVYQYAVPTGGYDSAGNLLSYTDTVMGTWNFTYDTLNRLAGAADAPPTGATTTLPNVSPNYCWSYDAFGNRTMQAGSSAAFSNSATCTADSSATLISAWATYNAKNQIIGTPQSPAGPVYDASGDVTDDGKNQYLYDAEGRICAVASTPVASMTTYTGYLYDADGTRVAKGTITKWSCDPSSNGFMTINDFVLGLGGEQVTEMGIDTTAGSSATTLAWQHTNVWAGGKLLGTYDKTGLHFYLDDPLGTRRAQTNYAGVLEQTCSSLPYGDALSCTGGDLAAPTEHHFTGKERDTESGNDYFEARYYTSAMGRFMSPDWSAKIEPVPYAKLDDPQTLNLYAYVENNPMDRVDVDGHLPAWVNSAIEKVISASSPPMLAPVHNVKPPDAPPIAMLETSIGGNTTSFTVSTHEKTTTTTIETHVKVTRAALKKHPDAGGPIHSVVRGVDNKHAGSDAYGPRGALIDAGDPRNRYIHGGGSGLPNTQADHQGWVPTEGCTRGQNTDVKKLGTEITNFQKNNPNTPISYDRK